VGLAVCNVAQPVLFHFARLPSDTIFIFVAILSIAAVWFAFRYWRILFGFIAEKLHWNAQTCRLIGFLILAVGFSLQYFVGPHHTAFVSFLCLPAAFAALGCSAGHRGLDRQGLPSTDAG